MRQLLGEALSAEDDAAVLQELQMLEETQAKAERDELPSVPSVPKVGLPVHQTLGHLSRACHVPSSAMMKQEDCHISLSRHTAGLEAEKVEVRLFGSCCAGN